MKEFLTAADNSLCKNEAEARKVFQSGTGFRIIEGRLWGHSPELIEKQRSLIRECLGVLSASLASEKGLISAMWDAAAAIGPEKAREDAFFDTIEAAQTVQKTFIGPNQLIRLTKPVDALTLGPVTIIATNRLNREIVERRVELRLGTREELQLNGSRPFLEFPPFAWKVRLLSSVEYAREEAEWSINIAASLVRLALLDYGKPPKRLFPYLGDVEPAPFERQTIHRDPGAILSQGGINYFGGSTTVRWYEIDSGDIEHFDKIKLGRIADLVFDARAHSVGERLYNGLGWLTLARQTIPRAERFVHYFTALEALLTRSDPTAPITQTIGRYLSCILSNENTERITLADTTKTLYAKRSALIHGGRRSEIHLSDVITLQSLVEKAYLGVILNIALETPATEFLNELDRTTYGIPWPSHSETKRP